MWRLFWTLPILIIICLIKEYQRRYCLEWCPSISTNNSIVRISRAGAKPLGPESHNKPHKLSSPPCPTRTVMSKPHLTYSMLSCHTAEIKNSGPISISKMSLSSSMTDYSPIWKLHRLILNSSKRILYNTSESMSFCSFRDEDLTSDMFKRNAADTV